MAMAWHGMLQLARSGFTRSQVAQDELQQPPARLGWVPFVNERDRAGISSQPLHQPSNLCWSSHSYFWVRRGAFQNLQLTSSSGPCLAPFQRPPGQAFHPPLNFISFPTSLSCEATTTDSIHFSAVEVVIVVSGVLFTLSLS